MHTQDSFSLGLVQLRANPGGEDYLAHGLSMVQAAAAKGAQIVVLPELFRSPYFCQDMTPDHFQLAEQIPGESTELISKAAKALGVVVIASLFEQHAPGLYFNTTAVIDADGTLLGTYRKSHIPDDPLYFEKFYFAPGDTGFKVFQTRFARVGVLICWDQWFPEAARLTAMQGAEVLIYPTAIGTIDAEGAAQHAMQLDAWQTIQRGHAIANGVYVAAVNRAGRERALDFWGHSFAVGPQGEFLAQAHAEPDHIAIAHCARSRMLETRNIWPYFRDRRVDLYGGLGKLSLPQR